MVAHCRSCCCLHLNVIIYGMTVIRTFSNLYFNRLFQGLFPSRCPSCMLKRALTSALNNTSAPKQIRPASKMVAVNESVDKVEAAKRAAARQCVDAHVKSGQVVGVGTGSTIVHVVERLGELVREGRLTGIHCIPSSFQARQLINSNGLNLSDMERHTTLDLYIDGADEVDSELNCIKGGGGCLTQEKIVMAEAKVWYVVGDYRKRSTVLGEQWPTIPLEVCQQAWRPISLRLKAAMGGEFKLRQAKAKAGPVVTDNGNFILDWDFPKGRWKSTEEWHVLNTGLRLLPGVVETGLFVGAASAAYFGMADGTVVVDKAPGGKRTPYRMAIGNDLWTVSDELLNGTDKAGK